MGVDAKKEPIWDTEGRERSLVEIGDSHKDASTQNEWENAEVRFLFISRFQTIKKNFSNINSIHQNHSNSIYLSAAWIKYFISTVARVSRFIDNPAQGAGHPGKQLDTQLDDLFHCYLDFCGDHSILHDGHKIERS